jgi:hypothetical protein
VSTTALLLFIAVEIPVTAGVILLVVCEMLKTHQAVMASVIGRRASDLSHELLQAEERVTEAAMRGVRARSGPARLRD